MNGRKIQARAAFVFAFSGIFCFILAILWSQTDLHKSLFFAPPPAFHASPAVAAAPQSPPPVRSGLDLDGIWRLAAQQPSVMADHLQAWLQPLLLQRSYADVEGLSLVAILKRPWWYPSIAVFQEARVRAFLAEGQYAQALSEAKSYYNLCPLNEMPTAIDLLTQALALTRGTAVANLFNSQATANLATSAATPDVAQILSSIHVNDSLYARGIEMTRAGSTQFPFDNQLSLGNLFLLADKPSDALDAFVCACRSTQNQWDLPKAIDGIARSLRARDCSLNSARQFRASLKASEFTTVLGDALPGDFSSDQLRYSADSIQLPRSTQLARTDLPYPPDSAFEKVLLPPARSERPFDLQANNLPTSDAVLLSRLETMGDAQLRLWMVQWMSSDLSSQIARPSRSQLIKLIIQSKLPTLNLVKLGDDFAQVCNDRQLPAIWMVACVRRTDNQLADLLEARRIDLIANGLIDYYHRCELKQAIARANLPLNLLFSLGENFGELSDGREVPRTTAIFFAAVVYQGHVQLQKYKQFGDQMLLTLKLMKETEPALWGAFGTTGDPECLRAVEVLSSDLDYWVPDNDPSLGWTKFWAKVALSECAIFSGDPVTGLARLRTISVASLTNEQKGGLAWVKALALSRANREEAALRELKICVEYGEFGHSNAASQLIALTYARLDNQAAAHAAFNCWIDSYHPTLADAAHLLDAIEHPNEPEIDTR